MNEGLSNWFDVIRAGHTKGTRAGIESPELKMLDSGSPLHYARNDDVRMDGVMAEVVVR
jgi:hypothetical protein